MASRRKSPNSPFARIQEPTINKSCCHSRKQRTNVLQKLYLREIKETGHHFTPFKKLPGRLAFKLSSLVSDFDLQFGYIFLGFTKDGQFMISYTMQIEEDVPAGFIGYVYKLQWWLFIPYQPLKKISEVRLFSETEITQELHLTVCQWPSDESLILVHGVCCGSDSTEQQLKQCFITVTPAPPAIFCSDCQCNIELHKGTTHSPACCLKHGFSVHTKYCVIPPFPAFLPNISLKIDKTVVINTGDSLIVFSVFLNKGKPSTEIAVSNEMTDLSQIHTPYSHCIENNNKEDFNSITNFKELIDEDSFVEQTEVSANKDKSVTDVVSDKFCSKSSYTSQENDVFVNRKLEIVATKNDKGKNHQAKCDSNVDKVSLITVPICNTNATMLPSHLAENYDRSSLSVNDTVWTTKNRSDDNKNDGIDDNHKVIVKCNTDKSYVFDSVHCSSNESKELAVSLWELTVDSGKKLARNDMGVSSIKSSILQSPELKKNLTEVNNASSNGCKNETSIHKEITECLQEVSANIVNSVGTESSLQENNSYDESLKENIKPSKESFKDLNVSKPKGRTADISNESKILTDDLLTSPSLSTDQASSSGSGDTTPHSCVSVLERVFVERKESSGIYEEEDNSTNSSYNNCLPLDIFGPNYKKMHYLSVNELPKIDCDSLIIRQQNFDVEQFIHEIAQSLCSNAGKRFSAINDYDIQLIDVHPDTAEVIVLAVMLLRTSVKVKENENSQNELIQQTYQTGFTFIWNILTGNYCLLDTQEFEEIVKNETNYIWNPAFLISEEIQKKGYVPQSYMKSVNVLTNAAVLRGKSLEVILEPYHHLAILL